MYSTPCFIPSSRASVFSRILLLERAAAGNTDRYHRASPRSAIEPASQIRQSIISKRALTSTSQLRDPLYPLIGSTKNRPFQFGASHTFLAATWTDCLRLFRLDKPCSHPRAALSHIDTAGLRYLFFLPSTAYAPDPSGTWLGPCRLVKISKVDVALHSASRCASTLALDCLFLSDHPLAPWHEVDEKN